MTPRVIWLLAVALVFGAGAYIIGRAQQPEPERPDRSLITSACIPAPSITPTYLPWLDKGKTVAEPHSTALERETILTWRRNATKASLTTTDRSARRLGSSNHYPRVMVRGYPGRMFWIGDPGLSEVVLVWEEPDLKGPCGTFRLSLLDQKLAEREAEAELKRIAASLESD